jgi:hypothetical protein
MLASRCIFIRMKRRAHVEHRNHPAQAKPIADALAEWCAEHEAAITGAEPEIPSGIEDRAADIWEPLFAIADAAEGDWPKRAREAAEHFTTALGDEVSTPNVELLAHVRDAFALEDKLWTKNLIDKLCERDESPWKDIRGKPLDDRGFSKRLKAYGIKSKDVWIGGTTRKEYNKDDFHDAWAHYLPACFSIKGDEGDIREEIDDKDKT